MTTKAIEKYVKERDEVLKMFSVSKLSEFMKKNENIIGADVVAMFERADETTKMGALCKMICNATVLEDTEVKTKAIKWLTDHHMSTFV